MPLWYTQTPNSQFNIPIFFLNRKFNQNVDFFPFQNGTMRLLPIYIRTLIMSTLAKRIRRAYLKDKKNTNTAVEAIDE